MHLSDGSLDSRAEQILKIFGIMVCRSFPNAALNRQLTPGPSSQIILLPTRSRVLIESPFHITIFVLQCSSPDLKTPHRHSRPNLRELDALIPGLDEYMVSYLDTVFDILESDDSASNLGFVRNCFSGRENMFQYLHNTKPKLRSEAFENKMRI
jgi:hypothetical protein